MKANSFILASVCFLLFIPILPLVHALTEDFNDGKADSWTVIGGKWEVKNDEYIGTADADEQVSYIGDDTWTDYTVEVKVKAKEARSGHFGLAIRESGKGQHYSFYISSDPGAGIRWFHGYYDNGWQGDWAPTKAYADATKWNTLKVVVKGFQFDYYINDTQLDSLTDKRGKLKGAVGVVIGRSGETVIFDDFNVEGPGIPGKSVEQKDKLATTWAFIKARF